MDQRQSRDSKTKTSVSLSKEAMNTGLIEPFSGQQNVDIGLDDTFKS